MVSPLHYAKNCATKFFAIPLHFLILIDYLFIVTFPYFIQNPCVYAGSDTGGYYNSPSRLGSRPPSRIRMIYFLTLTKSKMPPAS